MQLTIDDVRKRIRKLSEGSNMKRDYSMERQHESALYGNVDDALYCIENYHMTDYTNRLTSVLDLYDTVCENGSIAQIINATTSVIEGVVSKTRDPEQTRNSIKRKLAHIKGRVSGKVRNNISNAMDDMNNLTKNVKDNLSKNTSAIKDNVSKDVKKVKTVTTKEEAIVYGCESILEAYDTTVHCDRIIDNYNNLSRRFNIDKVLNENTVDGIYETTINVCRLVDTYDVKTRVKINTVAETVWYGFAKHGIDTDNSKILEAVTDFYINKPKGVEECAYVLRENVFFSDNDKKSVSYISEGIIDDYKAGISGWKTHIAKSKKSKDEVYIGNYGKMSYSDEDFAKGNFDTLKQINIDLVDSIKYKESVNDIIDIFKLQLLKYEFFKDVVFIRLELEEQMRKKGIRPGSEEWVTKVQQPSDKLFWSHKLQKHPDSTDITDSAENILSKFKGNISKPTWSAVWFKSADAYFKWINGPFMKALKSYERNFDNQTGISLNESVVDSNSGYMLEADTDKENKITFTSVILGLDNVLNNILFSGPWWAISKITRGAASAGKNTPLSKPLEFLAKDAKIKHAIFDNLKSHAIITGKFNDIRPNLLTIVDNAPNGVYLDNLLNDANYSISMLNTSADNMESAIKYKEKNGKPDPTYMALYTWIDNGNSPDKIRDHAKWIKGTYIPYIKSAKKKLKSSTNEATMIEDAIFDYVCEAKPHLAVTIDNNLRRLLESDTDYEKDDTSKFEKIVNDFKKSEDDKKETKLKNLIVSLYTKNIGNIIDETPNLLGYIRNVFVLGSFAINPICGAIVAIADQFIKLRFQREETEKMLKALDAEIKKTNKKIESEKDDNTRDRLEEYLKSLEDTREEIDRYYESLLTDNEINARYDEDFDEKDSFSNILDDDDSEGKDDDDDWGDWDDFNESHLSIIPKIERVMESISKYEDMDIIPFIESNIATIPYNLIVEFAKASIRYPEVINPDSYRVMVEHNLKDIRIGKLDTHSLSSKYLLMGALNEANLIFTDSKISQAKCDDIYDALRYTRSINAVYEAANIVQTAYNSSAYPVMEMSFKNTLALASEKLKKAMTDLSDTDKRVSKNIDTSMDNFSKAVEKSLTNDNREAIIKGTILPSASRMLKMVLAGGVTSVILGPVIAVIGVLGYIGTSKRYKAKERQMVLDEIEIELKMTQKYLDIAESKNDLKATKKLLTIQRNLERQRQRIKYKMSVETGKLNDPNDTPTDGVDD